MIIFIVCDFIAGYNGYKKNGNCECLYNICFKCQYIFKHNT